jgi:hypothetical protein
MNDENLNQELRVDPEDLLKKPVRQREKRRGYEGSPAFWSRFALVSLAPWLGSLTARQSSRQLR